MIESFLKFLVLKTDAIWLDQKPNILLIDYFWFLQLTKADSFVAETCRLHQHRVSEEQEKGCQVDHHSHHNVQLVLVADTADTGAEVYAAVPSHSCKHSHTGNKCVFWSNCNFLLFMLFFFGDNFSISNKLSHRVRN